MSDQKYAYCYSAIFFKIRATFFLVIASTFSIALPNCRSCHDSENFRDIAKSKKIILDLIDNSKEIVITEHSLPIDRPDRNDDWHIEYKRILLSSDQREELRSIVKSSGAKLKPGEIEKRLTTIEPHHAIILVSADKKIKNLTLQVSFGAGVLDGGENSEVFNHLHYPPDLIRSMEMFFTKLGLSPRANWERLASESK